MTDAGPRFSLVAGEGDGAMLGLAAGDAAGGAWELGYSAITEQATVLAYHLIEHDRIDTETLVRELRELDGSGEEEPVYRSESGQFRAWLDRAAAGRPVPEQGESLDGASRAVPLGVAHRRDPVSLRQDALALGRLFHDDVSAILAGVLAAAAVAASCFGQSGRDLIGGVVETCEPALADLGAEPATRRLIDGVTGLVGHIGVTDGKEAIAVTAGGNDPGPWELTLAGLLLSAPLVDPFHLPIGQAARIGGSPLSAMVGGIVGARLGIKAWPWAFANDTWFAEVGRRLARGPREVRDLPIPYAVEHHLISGERQGLY
ncbi:MAG TPA: ADP-ribosylglycohydrolase family protein [Acidimicrobiia bacterium]|nr:ADP-ribosylglycohydrolase family protein [Acidimicrobiia bacterium]